MIHNNLNREFKENSITEPKPNADVSALKAEIAALQESLKREKLKNEELTQHNLKLEDELKQVQLNYLNEENQTKKLKHKQRNFKEVIAEYESQLTQSQLALTYLNYDYEQLADEMLDLNRKFFDSTKSTNEHAKPKYLCKKLDSISRTLNKCHNENNYLKKLNKLKYTDYKQKIMFELNASIKEIVDKSRNLQELNENKLNEYQCNLERYLERIQMHNEKICNEIKSLEEANVNLVQTNTSLMREIEQANKQIKNHEKTNEEMLHFIKLQADEILELDEKVKEKVISRKQLELKLIEMEEASLTLAKNNEKHIKEVYDTVTEVFMERIEELKNENDKLKQELTKNETKPIKY